MSVMGFAMRFSQLRPKIEDEDEDEFEDEDG